MLGPSYGFPWSAYRFGQLFGVFGISSLTLQLVLTSRMMFLERGVGYDKLTRWHKLNSRVLTVFLVLHPVLLLWPFANFAQTLSLFTLYHWLGVTALLLIFFTVTITVYGHKLHLNYEYWKVIHKVGYVIVVLGFVHSIYLGHDVSTTPSLMNTWWFFLVGVAAYAFIYRNIYRPLKWKNNWFVVDRVVAEAGDVRSIYMKPQPGSTLNFSPGQFAFARIFAEHIPSEEHHFTLSSTPSDDTLRFTVKAVGDYTSLLSKLKKGARVRLEGPYGAFSSQGRRGPYVFIAAGIGITPLMSMISTMGKQKKAEKTTLIYINKSEKEIVFKKELDALRRQNPWLRVAYVLSQEAKRGYYHGHLTPEVIKREVDNPANALYFVVGPDGMMRATLSLLKNIGVSASRIFTERFALR